MSLSGSLKKTALAAFLCCAVVALSACHGRNADLKRSLLEVVERGPGTTFRMRDLTPFEWDRLYVIQPYASPEEINRVLGFEWAGAKSSNIDMFDTIRLLVFVKDAEVVASVEYQVWHGFFDDGGRHEYGADEAKFIVEGEEVDGAQVLKIRWVP